MDQVRASDLTISVDSPVAHVAWARDLCKQFRDELGGVHLGIIDAHASMGHLLLAESAGQLVGCFVSKPGLASDDRVVPIIAAAVPSDLHRLHVGLAMLDRWIHHHQLTPGRIIQACCRSNLPSNRFWAAAGFRPAFIRSTDAARSRPLVVWRRRVDGGHEGCGVYHAPRKPRGGGGRWIPQAQPERAERVSHDPLDIFNALEHSGLGEWGLSNGHAALIVSQSLPLVEPFDPHPQMTLFPAPQRSALTNGR